MFRIDFDDLNSHNSNLLMPFTYGNVIRHLWSMSLEGDKLPWTTLKWEFNRFSY